MLKCDYCGKTQKQVDRLIVGNNGAAICSGCVLVCMEVLFYEMKRDFKEIKFEGEKENE
jgi:ATP-dependent Clp protease ATP-binding subunit ClpX